MLNTEQSEKIRNFFLEFKLQFILIMLDYVRKRGHTMKSTFYTEANPHCIYAILNIEKRLAYVGKSRAKDPRARLNAHLRGECRWTRDEFGPESDDPPDFYILESIKCPGAEAYRHIVAWCRFFEENEFELLMSPGVCRACRDFLPETEAIYNTECANLSLEEALTRDVPMQMWTRKGTALPAKQSTPLTQLNLRVREDVVQNFRRFCRENDITQSEGLRILLVSAKGSSRCDMALSMQRELKRQEQCLRMMEANNKELRIQLKSAAQTNSKKLKEWAAVMRKLLDSIAEAVPHAELTNPKLKVQSFHVAKKSVDFKKYQYPAGSNLCTVRLDALVYGKGLTPPIFVLGHTLEGIPIKLRWYPKAEWVGFPPKATMYACKDAKWLMGYLPAKDGAMDLIASVPIEGLQVKVESSSEQHVTSSLDDLIINAMRNQ